MEAFPAGRRVLSTSVWWLFFGFASRFMQLNIQKESGCLKDIPLLSEAQGEHDGLKSKYHLTACLPTGSVCQAEGMETLPFIKCS